MEFVKESMKFPVDNLLGMYLYAVLFMLITGLVVGLALRFIPNRIPYALKSAIVAIFVFFSLVIWWNVIVK